MNTANCDLFLFFQAKNKIYVVSPYATDPKKGPTLKKKIFFHQNLYFRGFL